MYITEQAVILSANLEELDNIENEKRSGTLEQCLVDCSIKFKKGESFFSTGTKDVFVCIPKDEAEVGVLKDLAFKSFGQESLLLQDSNGAAHLIESSGKESLVGRLSQCNPKYIEAINDYILLGDRIYTIEKL